MWLRSCVLFNDTKSYNNYMLFLRTSLFIDSYVVVVRRVTRFFEVVCFIKKKVYMVYNFVWPSVYCADDIFLTHM